MNHTDMKKICKTFNSGFDEIEKHVMEWGRNNKALQKDIRTIMSLNTNPRYPKGYGGMSTGNYLLALFLTDPEAMQKLSKKQDIPLTAKGKQVLSHWIELPAFWCYFSIKEQMEDDFMTITDLLSGEEHLLYSPGISSMQKKQDTRVKHYLCLMLGNGECLQTVGILRYNSLSISDFRFYCDLFETEMPLGTIINKHYTKFFSLDEISTLPIVMHKENEVVFAWQEFSLEDFDITRLGGQWLTNHKGEQTSYALQSPDKSMMDVPYGDLLETDFPSTTFSLYRNTKTGSMAINTTALTSYTIIASLLQRAYPSLELPRVPEVAISMVLASLLARMDLDLPWSKFKALMDYEEKTEKPESDDMANMNTLLGEYMVAQNSGKPFDAKAYSKKSGMNLEIVESVLEALQKTYSKNMPSYEVAKKDMQYELSGWPVPPPTKRRVFSDSLVDSELFGFDEGPNTLSAFDALSGGLYKDEIFKKGLLEFIEHLFIEYFDDYRFVCMLENTFFWILFHKGREWLPVRSYAIEIAKLFPYPIKQAYSDVEEFIEDFSLFTRKILTTRGVCSLETRPKASEIKTGLYAIKGSDAFFSLVESVNM